MEPPPSSSSTAASGKLRLMCSYGGHIVPRPRTKSLCYIRGDTRIIAIDRHTITTLDSLITHLSATLSLNFSLTLKYQLPHLDLDSLISVTSDEDFQILIDEHDRHCSNPSLTPSRIRVFLFSTKLVSGQPVIHHPKTEAWFFDALKSAKIMQKGRHCLRGMEGEAYGCGSGAGAGVEARSGGELSHGFLSSGPESMVLETSSSFGSTSSSASLSNLPPMKAQVEDNELDFQDSKVKLSPSNTVRSDNTVSNNVPYQDPVVHGSSMETKANTETIKLESKIPNISSGIIVNNTNMDVGYTSFPSFNQVQRQHVQFVQTGTHFIPDNPSGLLPAPSYQQMYQQPQPVQHLVYHPNQPYPVYLVPFGQIPPNDLPSTASSQAAFNLNASFMASHVPHNSKSGARSPFAPYFASQSYRTANSATSFVHVPYDGSQQQEIDHPPMYPQSQTIAITSRESPKYGNELDGDHAHVQIYKSQPPPPSLPSQYRTMTKDTTVLLSEGSAQLHVESLKQRTETSQPQ